MTTPAPTGSELPPPTLTDVLDAAVMAMNNLMIYGVRIRETDREAIADAEWDALVEADYALNSIRDNFTGYWEKP